MTTSTTVRVAPVTRERCDRCPAAARVRAELPFGELLFCLHHAREHRGPLLATGATLTAVPPP